MSVSSHDVSGMWPFAARAEDHGLIASLNIVDHYHCVVSTSRRASAVIRWVGANMLVKPGSNVRIVGIVLKKSVLGSKAGCH